MVNARDVPSLRGLGIIGFSTRGRPVFRKPPETLREIAEAIESPEARGGVVVPIKGIRRIGLPSDIKITASSSVDDIRKDLLKKEKPLIILGGEHLITLGTYPSFPKETGFIVFDAHYDLR
ncbi:hypothetical protein LCGC14_2518130, partial [marine sediment metagenome]